MMEYGVSVSLQSYVGFKTMGGKMRCCRYWKTRKKEMVDIQINFASSIFFIVFRLCVSF